MRQKSMIPLILAFSVVSFTSITLIGCDDDDEDVTLPPISGYNNSNEVGASNLVGYWPFDGSNNENKTGTAATSAVNASFVTGGVKGQALSLTNGYVYYASPLAPLTSGQGFSVSAWIQVKNTGGSPTEPANKPYMYFQHAVPTQIWGNVNALVEAGQFSHLSDTLVLKSLYKDQAGGLQDNINNWGTYGTEIQAVKKAGTNQWVHVVTTYSPTGGTGGQNLLRIYADSVLVSNKNFENRTTNTFTATTPHEIIIGGWYNNIPGKEVNTDDWTVPFNGKIDEVRVYNKTLTAAEIAALFQLGKAGR